MMTNDQTRKYGVVMGVSFPSSIEYGEGLCPHKKIVGVFCCIFTRDSIHAIARICYGNSVCLSVRPSVTRVDQSKTVEAIFTVQ